MRNFLSILLIFISIQSFGHKSENISFLDSSLRNSAMFDSSQNVHELKDSSLVEVDSNKIANPEAQEKKKKSPFTPEELMERQFKKTAFLVIGGFVMLGIVLIVFRLKKSK